MIDPKYLVIHHSASPLTTTAADIDRWHREKGWDGAGYSHIIEGDGRLVFARGLRHWLAANPPHNGDSVAVCVVGDNRITGRVWNLAQIDTLDRYIAAVVMLYPDILIGGHREIGSTPTECPGVDLRDLPKIGDWMRTHGVPRGVS